MGTWRILPLFLLTVVGTGVGLNPLDVAAARDMLPVSVPTCTFDEIVGICGIWLTSENYCKRNFVRNLPVPSQAELFLRAARPTGQV